MALSTLFVHITRDFKTRDIRGMRFLDIGFVLQVGSYPSGFSNSLSTLLFKLLLQELHGLEERWQRSVEALFQTLGRTGHACKAKK